MQYFDGVEDSRHAQNRDEAMAVLDPFHIQPRGTFDLALAASMRKPRQCRGADQRHGISLSRGEFSRFWREMGVRNGHVALYGWEGLN